jgi:purine-nucleoside/S-methyl-5'-thioadenosine phosphorylase / adenosine deaminase
MVQPQPNDGFEWTQAPWGPVLRCRPLLAVADHFFTVANLELRDTRAEWDAVAAEIKVDAERILLLRQVHGTGIAVARRGGGMPATRPEADIALTDDPTIALGVRVADCAPILVADRRRAAVAAVHAGWRGTVKGAAAVAIHAMQEQWQTRPADLVAAVGPCLGHCCGEVGPEVVDAFRQAGHAPDMIARWFTGGTADRFQLDLPGANRDQLAAAGVPLTQIHVAGLCTKSFPEVFHSYRVKKAEAGRMVGIIRVNPVNA